MVQLKFNAILMAIFNFKSLTALAKNVAQIYRRCQTMIGNFAGSCYTTISLAFERLSAMKLRRNAANVQTRSMNIKAYPTDPVILAIFISSVIYNLPRFFDTTLDYLEITKLKKINNTGDPLNDMMIVKVRKQSIRK